MKKEGFQLLLKKLDFICLTLAEPLNSNFLLLVIEKGVSHDN